MAESEIPEVDTDAPDLSESFKRGILTNLLNPSVYIFWFLVGGPIMATAADKEPLAPIAYAVSFLVSIVLVKTTIAYLFSQAQGNISAEKYQLALRICGIAMFIFAISFVSLTMIIAFLCHTSSLLLCFSYYGITKKQS